MQPTFTFKGKSQIKNFLKYCLKIKNNSMIFKCKYLSSISLKLLAHLLAFTLHNNNYCTLLNMVTATAKQPNKIRLPMDDQMSFLYLELLLPLISICLVVIQFQMSLISLTICCIEEYGFLNPNRCLGKIFLCSISSFNCYMW